jgi:DNA-binding response OmpR family regulator
MQRGRTGRAARECSRFGRVAGRQPALELLVLGTMMVPPTLLVAEDDPAMLRWLVLILTSLGGPIHAVSDGWKARSVLMHEHVDLVVSDLRMPISSGFETLAVIRMAGNRVPFLLITAFGDDEVREAAAELGAEVLAKPFGAVELLARVERMCQMPA